MTAHSNQNSILCLHYWMDTVAWRRINLTFLSVCRKHLLRMLFPLVYFLCLILTVPNLALTYRLIRNRLFGSVFNLHSVFMFLLTAIKTPLSVAIKLTLITEAENFFEFSCHARPLMEWIWLGSMVIGAVYALLFKYK